MEDWVLAESIQALSRPHLLILHQDVTMSPVAPCRGQLFLVKVDLNVQPHGASPGLSGGEAMATSILATLGCVLTTDPLCLFTG